MAADGPWRRERRGGNFQGKQCYRIGGVGTGVGGGGAVDGSAASRMVGCSCWPFSDSIDLMLYVKLTSHYCDDSSCVSACPRDIPPRLVIPILLERVHSVCYVFV